MKFDGTDALDDSGCWLPTGKCMGVSLCKTRSHGRSI